METKTSLYCCYSLEQRKFLTSRNIRYEVVGLNPNNQQMFWVYIKDEKLDILTSEWSKRDK